MVHVSHHPALSPGGVAVVTGAASGIGRAAAERLAMMGMKLCLVDRNGAGLAETLAALPPGRTRMSEALDVADAGAMQALAADVAGRLGTVNVLMNNAGVAHRADALGDPDAWTHTLGVNLLGVLHGVQSFVPAMVAGDQPGLVINTGSKQGITQPPGDTAYNVSKAAVKALTEGLAHSLRTRTGRRVSAHLLIPGFTLTGMTGDAARARPEGAWSPEQVIDRMVAGLDAGSFYILCQDNETTRTQDERRILWAAGDIVSDRPALSRWHPAYEDAFAAWMDA